MAKLKYDWKKTLKKTVLPLVSGAVMAAIGAVLMYFTELPASAIGGAVGVAIVNALLVAFNNWKKNHSK